MIQSVSKFSNSRSPVTSLKTKVLFDIFLVACAFALCLPCMEVLGQGASVAQALAIKPKQADAPFEQPSASDAKLCKIEKSTNPPGFIVTDGNGRTLRQFFDNNKDGKLDQWSYFENGIEVYRDIDTDFDRKTDQYRWLGSGGTRWGLDPDEDGQIDSWKTISAEEVAYETFMAIRDSDAERFDRLLLTPDEFSSLKLGKTSALRIKERWQAAKTGFSKAVAGSLKLPKKAKWVQWGNGKPSMCAAGTEGNAQDVVCYDHASGVYQSGDDFGQIAIGSMVNVGNVWRLVELPELVAEGQPINNGGVLFPLDINPPVPPVPPVPNRLAELYEKVSDLDADLTKEKKDSKIAALHKRRAAVMQEIYFESDKADRRNWLENIADTVTSGYVDEHFPDGLRFLDDFVSRLKKEGVKDGIDYIAWRSISAKAALAMNIRDNKGRAKAEQQLSEDIEDFVDRYPKSDFSARGMFQLALNSEISERDEKRAVNWYKKIADSFPRTEHATRAMGAIRRLAGQGKPLAFKGKSAKGRPFSLADRSLRGKLIVLHFWESWCPNEFDTIERLAEKHKGDVVFVGCNTDTTTAQFTDFMAKNRNVTWLQLHQPGGVEKSPLAHQLGVSTLPLVLLVDGKGKLVESNLAFGDLEREIQLELRRAKRAK